MIKIRQKIDKAEVARLPVVTFGGRIIVVQTEGEAEKAVNYLLRHPVVGVDTETRPTFKKGVINKVALLQVSTEDTCFLFRINMIGLCPPVLRFLQADSLLKIGLSLKDDFHSLHYSGDFETRNFVDLQHLVGQVGIQELSLQKIYAILFGMKISKRQRLTNWEADVLDDRQKSYAAIDAWACLKIYDLLCELLKHGDYELLPLPEPENMTESNS